MAVKPLPPNVTPSTLGKRVRTAPLASRGYDGYDTLRRTARSAAIAAAVTASGAGGGGDGGGGAGRLGQMGPRVPPRGARPGRRCPARRPHSPRRWARPTRPPSWR